MNTKLKATVIENEAAVAHHYDRALSVKLNEVSRMLNSEEALNDASIHESAGRERSVVITIGMFLASPFIALAYIIALPFIGFYQIAKLALEAYAKNHPVNNGKLKKVATMTKNIGLFFAAPFIALGYVIALPFVGLYMFSKLAMEARASLGLRFP